jgi:oligopeptide/dipeptide ABC transporter ATP-binding protein
MPPIIELRKVSKFFGKGPDATVALDDMTFSVDAEFSKIITVAGESGSGKTTMLMLILGFYEPSLGNVLYHGKDIWKMNQDETIDFRRNVQAVFQDPFAVYNPFYKVDNLLSIPIKNFKLAKNNDEARALMESALRRVGLRPEETLGRYPHQLSGGQRQRIAVARALVLQPKLLLADEPVSMVDASLRATILKQIRELNQDLNIPIIYITHDLTTAYHVSDYIMVMYKGAVMEVGNVERVIKDPKNPYTQLLVNSIPWPDPNLKWGAAVEAARDASLGHNGCRFASRCPHAFEPCTKAPPPLYQTSPDQATACYLYQNADVLQRGDITAFFKKIQGDQAKVTP